MARQLRIFSNSKIYHIIIKGIDSQEIFYDDMDRKKFLNSVKETQNLIEFKINAYCLMGNHVHIVLKIKDDDLSDAIRIILIRYVSYFNKKYHRTGPLFQDRFKSKNVENLNYFLEVCRYVHRNPEKAGIAITSEYKWSSYKEYIGKSKLVDTSILMHYFNNNINEFERFTNKVDDLGDMLKYAEYEIQNRLSDEEVVEIIMKQFNISEQSEVLRFFKDKPLDERKKCAKEFLKIEGTNITQLSRITRLNRDLFK